MKKTILLIMIIFVSSLLLGQGRRKYEYTRTTVLTDSALFTVSEDSSGTRVTRNILRDNFIGVFTDSGDIDSRIEALRDSLGFLRDTINMIDTDHNGAADNIQALSVTRGDLSQSVQDEFDYIDALHDTINMIDTDHDGKVNSINDGVINYGMMDGQIKTITGSAAADTFWTYLGTAGAYTAPRVMSLLNVNGYWPLEYATTTLASGWWIVSHTAQTGPSDATTVSTILFIIEQ